MKMNGIIRFIKSLFGRYEPGYEYEMKCFDIGNDLEESERLNAS